MFITDLGKSQKIRPNMEGAIGVFKQVPLSRDNGAPTFSFRVFTIEPNGHTPLHNHPFEHLNYVIEGSGTIATGGNEIAIKKGNFAMILPGETHQFKNKSSAKPLIIICAVPKEYE